jgi:hypothetical protein
MFNWPFTTTSSLKSIAPIEIPAPPKPLTKEEKKEQQKIRRREKDRKEREERRRAYQRENYVMWAIAITLLLITITCFYKMVYAAIYGTIYIAILSGIACYGFLFLFGSMILLIAHGNVQFT